MASFYWNGNGAEQAKYDEMLAAGWEFTKASMEDMHRYYRFYNDGDLPGWARSRYDLKTWDYNHYGCIATQPRYAGAWTLNEAGKQELEARATATVLKEWKRYQKATRKTA